MLHTSQVIYHPSKHKLDSFCPKGWAQGRMVVPTEIEPVICCIMTKKLVLWEIASFFLQNELEYNGTHLSQKTIQWPSIIVQEWSMEFSLTSILTLHDFINIFLSTTFNIPLKMCSGKHTVVYQTTQTTRVCVHFLLSLV